MDVRMRRWRLVHVLTRALVITLVLSSPVAARAVLLA